MRWVSSCFEGFRRRRSAGCRCRRSRCAPRTPFFRNTGGFRPRPTPAGVPVAITSPGVEGDAARDGFDQRGDVEDQVFGAAILAQAVVDPAAHARVLAVQLVGGDDPRTHGTEGVEALAHVPLLVAHLHVARGHVVDDGVAEHVLHRVFARDVLATRADDHSQLGFVVDLFRHRRTGQHHIVAVGDHTLGHLGEHDGPGGRVGVVVLEHRGLQLFGVFVVIATHAPQVAPGQGERRLQAHGAEGNGRTRQRRQCLPPGGGLDQWKRSPSRRAVDAEQGHAQTVGRHLANPPLTFMNKRSDAHTDSLNKYQ